MSFELGGKNAAIVFADADLDVTIDGLTRSVFANTGQVCLCTERVYVQRPIFDEIADGLAAAAQALRLGRPSDEATTTGPLISRSHREKVLSYMALARESGPTSSSAAGFRSSARTSTAGAWIEPTLWTGLPQEDRVLREEIFGPVAALMPFDTEEEAVALANDTEYGLAASTLDHRPAAWPPGGPADARRHLLGQHLVPAGSAFAVRRHGPVRDRPRGRGLLARLLHGADERVREAVTVTPAVDDALVQQLDDAVTGVRDVVNAGAPDSTARTSRPAPPMTSSATR